jgi:hypothetical protein
VVDEFEQFVQIEMTYGESVGERRREPGVEQPATAPRGYVDGAARPQTSGAAAIHVELVSRGPAVLTPRG